jgi:hypothetical protein
VKIGIQAVGGHTGKKIYFICTGDGDQKVGIHNACIQKDLLGGTVALDSHHIVTGHGLGQNASVHIDHGKVVALLRKLLQKGNANFTVACDDNMHKDLTPYKRIVKPL